MVPPIASALVLLGGAAGTFGCEADDRISDGSQTEQFIFEDGFETQNNTFDELFPPDGSRWTNVQQVDPNRDSFNQIAITDTLFSEGSNALRVFAYASDEFLSKMDIVKDGFRAFENDRVLIEADFYLSGNANIENLLLIDLECCSCWDDSSGVENQCPGIRLQMSGGNDFLSIERGKIAEPTLGQSSFRFPRNEWVNVQWELTLADTANGTNRLLINGIEVINSPGTNMPNAQTFREVFAREGVDFNLREPAYYERVQIGATANPTSENIELLVDNFSIHVRREGPSIPTNPQ